MPETRIPPTADAGHFLSSSRALALTARPNLTLCESFCEELWLACGRTITPSRALAERSELSPALLRNGGAVGAHEFCVGMLGLRVVVPDDHAPCFAGGRMASTPTRWLSVATPLALAVWHLRQGL